MLVKNQVEHDRVYLLCGFWHSCQVWILLLVIDQSLKYQVESILRVNRRISEKMVRLLKPFLFLFEISIEGYVIWPNHSVTLQSFKLKIVITLTSMLKSD